MTKKTHAFYDGRQFVPEKYDRSESYEHKCHRVRHLGVLVVVAGLLGQTRIDQIETRLLLWRVRVQQISSEKVLGLSTSDYVNTHHVHVM